jgi:hypothetical protein
VNLPEDFCRCSYLSRVITCLDDDAHFGSQDFIDTFTTSQTRLERLRECYQPVPYNPTTVDHPLTPDTLPTFPTFAMVSQAFKLNFWQHVMFEVCAPHLLYAYAIDIEDAADDGAFVSQNPATSSRNWLGILAGRQ